MRTHARALRAPRSVLLVLIAVSLVLHACETGTRIVDRTDDSGEGTCQVSASELDFGLLLTGEARRDSAVVRNVGAAPLVVRPAIQSTGRAAGGGAFSLVDDEPFTLVPGRTRTLHVDFRPLDPDLFEATLVAQVGCGTRLVGRGDAPAACAVEPGVLDVGPVVTGNAVTREVVFRNAGGDTLRGDVRLGTPCEGVSLTAGAGPFALAGGESLAVAVRVAPVTEGEIACVLESGNDGCGEVPIVARGEPPALCVLSDEALDLGLVAQGESASASLTITNGGGDVLAGDVQLAACAGFALTAGAGPFALGAGESREIGIAFSPTGAGPFTCELTTGVAACPTVALSAAGDDLPVCAAPAAPLTIGDVPLGGAASVAFDIGNTGGGTLTGTVSLGPTTGERFTIVQGEGPFALARDETRTIVVTLAPEGLVGPRSATVLLGAACGTVEIEGSAVEPAACVVTPPSFAFGTVFVGDSATETVTIQNTGGAPLALDVTLGDCPGAFTITAGGGPRTLDPSESVDVALAFSPLASGAFACTLDLGSGCPGVSVTANAEPAPACELSRTSIAFGTLVLGQPAPVETFTITNVGGGTLSGTVSVGTCDGAAFGVQGTGAYALGGGESHTVTITFDPPAAGSYACTILTGCDADVSVTGAAEDPPICDVSPTHLDFGDVPLGCGVVERTFTITNVGDGVLSGTVSEDCPGSVPFTIVAGAGAFSLGADQSRQVRVRFTPASVTPGTAGTPFGSAVNGCSVVFQGGCGAETVTWAARSVVSYACDLRNRFGSTTCASAGCHGPAGSALDWTVYSNVISRAIHPDEGDVEQSRILACPLSGTCPPLGGDPAFAHPGGTPLATDATFRERLRSWLLNGCPNN